MSTLLKDSLHNDDLSSLTVEERARKGRERILRCLDELGAAKSDVPLLNLQRKYLLTYEDQLNKTELRKYFQKGAMQPVVQNFLSKDVELKTADEQTGSLFFRFKRPLREALSDFNYSSFINATTLHGTAPERQPNLVPVRMQDAFGKMPSGPFSYSNHSRNEAIFSDYREKLNAQKGNKMAQPIESDIPKPVPRLSAPKPENSSNVKKQAKIIDQLVSESILNIMDDDYTSNQNMKPCASKSRTVDKKPITTGEKDLIDFEDKAGGGKNNEDITGYGSDSSDLSLSLEKIVVGNGNLHVDQDEDGDEFDELEEGNRQILDEEKKKKCDEEVPSFNGPQKIKVVPLKKDGGRIPPTQKISNAEKLMKNVVEAAQKQRAEQKQQQKSVKPMEIGGKLQKSGNKVVEFEGYESDGVYPDNEDIEDDNLAKAKSNKTVSQKKAAPSSSCDGKRKEESVESANRRDKYMALGMTVEGLYRELDDYEPRWAQDMKRRFQKLIDLYEEKLWKAYNEEEEDNEGISY